MKIHPALVTLSVLVAGAVAADAPAAAAPRTHVVVIDKMKFGAVPPNLHKGDKIVWVNRDMFRHTATAADKSFDVDLPPSTKRVTVLRSAGMIKVVCKFHPGMRTVLKVS
jgi:plastocyanin